MSSRQDAIFFNQLLKIKFLICKIKSIPELLDSGRKIWTLDSGRWTLDTELWMLDSECWTLDAGL